MLLCRGSKRQITCLWVYLFCLCVIKDMTGITEAFPASLSVFEGSSKKCLSWGQPTQRCSHIASPCLPLLRGPAPMLAHHRWHPAGLGSRAHKTRPGEDFMPWDKMVLPELISHFLVLFPRAQILPQEHVKVAPSL